MATKIEGFGAGTTGGTGHPIVRVTTLADSGPGSLREALNGSNRRIVFDIGGTIDLLSKLSVNGDNITIDGTSAPFPGVTLSGRTLEIWGHTNIIIRGIRSRNTRDVADDGIRIYQGSSRIVVDHCSVGLFGDGAIDVTERCHDITIQWCILWGADIDEHNLVSLCASYGSYRSSVHHNLFFRGRGRNPRSTNERATSDNQFAPESEINADIRNNVVWQYYQRGVEFGNGARANVRNCYLYWVNGSTLGYVSNSNEQGEGIYLAPGEGASIYTAGNLSRNAGFSPNSQGNRATPHTVAPAFTPITLDAVTAAHQVRQYAGARGANFGLDSLDQTAIAALDALPAPSGQVPAPPGDEQAQLARIMGVAAQVFWNRGALGAVGHVPPGPFIPPIPPDVPATTPNTLTFAIPQDGVMKQFGYVIPSVESVFTTPGAINLGGMDKSLSSLGQRESVAIKFANHKHSDHIVDKYRLDRREGFTGVAYVDFPGTNGNFATTPDSVANSITDDIDIRLRVKMESWTPPSTQTWMAKRIAADGGNSWRFGLNGDGTPSFAWSADGANMLFMESTAAIALPANAGSWVRFKLDVDNESGGRTGRFYKASFDSEDPSWTLISTVTQPGTTSIFDSPSQVSVGAWNTTGTAQVMSGEVWRAQIYMGSGSPTEPPILTVQAASLGLGGATVDYSGGGGGTLDGELRVDFNPMDAAGDGATTWQSSTTGETWTLRQSGSPASRLFKPESFEATGHGTFWGKWLARNPYYPNYPLRIYEGALNFALPNMSVRHYLVDKIKGPDSGGHVTVTAKDYFSRIEAKKSVAPKASRGELVESMAESGVASFPIGPVGIGDIDYPAGPIYVRIGAEVLQVSRSGDTMTVMLRGAFGSEAETHDAEDVVQWCLHLQTMLAHDIVDHLLRHYTPINDDQIEKWRWDAVADEQLFELYSALITEPTPVEDLIGELAEQVGFTVFPNVAHRTIEFVPLRASAPVFSVTDDMIIKDSLSIARQEAKRVSQVWVWYGMANVAEGIDDRKNFHSRLVVGDPESEGDTKYGAPAIREVFSRWIPQFGRQTAIGSADRLLFMFIDPPLEATFSIRADAVPRDLRLAHLITLATDAIEDDVGLPLQTVQAITSLDRGEDNVTFKTQQVRFVPFVPGDGTDERLIFIDHNVSDFNLRSVHDSLYRPPVQGDVVRLRIIGSVRVGSTNISTAAIDTGEWPEGVTLHIENEGTIQGRGGIGGNGGTRFVSGGAGQNGGPAFRARYPVNMRNNGSIWGGGGGGGGGSGYEITVLGATVWYGGGGGGGGGGQFPGSGGSGGTSGGNQPHGQPGAPGTITSGGAAGAGAGPATVSNPGGRGGDPGSGGAPGSWGPGGTAYGIGGGGGPGAAVMGNSFINWLNTGERRGPIQ